MLFPIWLAIFYCGWLSLLVFGGYFHLLKEHWAIAVAMAMGSYVAGSTPMGGGTIGFPVLVLLFDQPADIGRQFSFAVQSIGMTSASIFIFSRRMPVAWNTLRWACLGSLIATPLGVAFVAPNVNDLFIKLLFAVLWASFGVMHFIKVGEITRLHGIDSATPRFELAMGLFVGLFGGGFIASTTGIGIDMLVYVLLVLVRRCDLRTAIPTSVILMSFTSLVGIGTSVIFYNLAPGTYPIKPGVFGNWIAAAPIVALGAPLGAYMVNLIPRAYTLIFVSILCIVQFVWTCVHEHISWLGVAGAVAAVLACNVVYHGLYRWGKQRAAREKLLAHEAHVSQTVTVSTAPEAVAATD